MDQIIADVLDAAARQDRVALVELLHPYLHWTEAGRTIRGRNNVFARLADGPPPAPPGSYELRDGQIYRWNARVGAVPASGARANGAPAGGEAARESPAAGGG